MTHNVGKPRSQEAMGPCPLGCPRPHPTSLGTFNEHLGRCGVRATGVRGQAGVAPCVVLKGLGYDQRVQVAPVPADPDVGTVVQLDPLTEPSAGQTEVPGQEGEKGKGDV